jgi:N-acetylglucosamine malate deacetylase 1
MKILIVSSHPDDIEFAMGATLNRLTKGSDYIEVHIFSQSEDIHGNEGIQEECNNSIHGIYKLDLHIHKYPTMHFSEHQQAIRDDIFKIKQEMHPDVVYCKSPNAIHPDHRLIGQACESIFLEQTIYAMEGVRDGHNQMINKWVEVSEDDLNVKIDAIACYKSQHRRGYSNAKTIEAWARFRGNQVGLQLAEGFEVLREIS